MSIRSILKRAAALCLCLCLLPALTGCSTESRYEAANRLLAKGNYEKAAEAFEALGSYQDSSLMTIYAKAAAAGENGEYEVCLRAFDTLDDFKDSPMMSVYYAARRSEAQAAAAAEGGTPEEKALSGCSGYYLDAAALYDTLPLFRDSDTRAESCRQTVYRLAEECAAQGSYQAAYRLHSQLSGYSDSALLQKYWAARYLENCAATGTVSSGDALDPTARVECYADAANKYDDLPLFKDSGTRAPACREAGFAMAQQLAAEGLYQEAAMAYEALGTYQDSESLSAYCAACALEQQEAWEDAACAFEKLGGYGDAAARAQAARETCYGKAEALLADGDAAQAAELFGSIGGFAPEGKPSGDEMQQEALYRQAEQTLAAGDYDEACKQFSKLADYRDAAQRVLETRYLQGLALMAASEPDYMAARTAFAGAGEAAPQGPDGAPLPPPAEQIARCWYLQGEAILADKGGSGIAFAWSIGELNAIEAFRNAGSHAGGNIRLQQFYYQLGMEELTAGNAEAAARCFARVGSVNDHYAAEFGESDPLFTAEQLAADTAAAGMGDWQTKAQEAWYRQGKAMLEAGEHGHALLAFQQAGGHEDAKAHAKALRELYRGILTAGQMHVLALKPDGTVLAWGEDWDEGGTNVSEWTDMAAVSADLRKSVGLTRDGTLVETLGKEWEIMLAVGDATSYAPKGTDLAVVHALSGPSVALDQPHAIGVRKDGTYFGPTEFYDSLFDSDERIEALLEAQSWTGLADVQSSYEMVVGLKTDGTLLVAGSNEHGQHDARSWTDIQAIALGGDFVAGLKNDGTVLFAGNDRGGMLDVSGWTDIVAIAADEHLIGLKANGTVVATGSKSDVMLVDGWHKIVAIAVNREHTFGLTADGKVLTSKGRYDDDPLEAWEGIVPDPARLVLP